MGVVKPGMFRTRVNLTHCCWILPGSTARVAKAD